MMEELTDIAALAGDSVAEGLRMLKDSEAPATLLPAVLFRTGLIDGYSRIETAIGPMFLAYNNRGISALSRVADAAKFESDFTRRTGRRVQYLPAPPEPLAHNVAEWLLGNKNVNMSFDLRGLTSFEESVLRKALEIPHGEVRPYSWIAREIGNPKAVRAVGTALGNNPVPLLIPCHRVVRSDGHMGNYALGPEIKLAVLRSEGTRPEELEALASRGVRYYGSDTTHIYCYPSCRHARRVTDRHRMTFPNEAAAKNAGYRPCKVCKPIAAA